MRRTSNQLPKRPEQPNGSNAPNGVQVDVQELWVAEQICNHVPIYKLSSLLRRRFHLSVSQAKTRIEAVRERWAAEDKGQVDKWKAEATRRLQTGMEQARIELKDRPQQKHTILLRYEDQLAKLQGTYAPLRVDIDVTISQQLVGVVANLTADQMAEHIARYRETQRLAAEYKRLSSPSNQAAAE
jgi:hypothetical protein